MTASTAEGPITLDGVVGAVSGRTGHISANQDILMANKEVVVVTSIGRDDPTTAEAKRAAIILQILQGQEKLLDTSPWINNIWFIHTSDTDLSWPMEWSQTPSTTSPKLAKLHSRSSIERRVLNSSQQTAVNAMLSEQDNYRITIIQGPPGTGKTSVISSFVQFSIQSKGRSGIWLVAQSNVAVKNIAEKLLADGFTDWKLLVSKDFRFDW
jgi:regulator of nonsense transcripts 1